MTDITAKNDRLAPTLLVLRLLVFGVLLMWGLDKIVNAEQAAQIYEAYYSLTVPTSVVPVIGVLELALLAAFLVGYRKRLTRAVLLAMMGISCLAPGRFYLTPFHDHILLYFARFPVLAVVFMLYYLRDRDTLWTLPTAGRQSAAAAAPPDTDPRLPLCLFLIRAGVFFDLFMWNMDKFFHPLQTSRIFAGFYSVGRGLPFTSELSYAAVYLMGGIQLALILAFLLGVRKRFIYGLIFALHTVSTFAPWERFLQPFTSHTLLFLVSFPMLGGIGALYYLRERDVLFTVGAGRRQRASSGQAAAGESRAALLPIGRWSREAQAALLVIVAGGLYVAAATTGQWRTERERGPNLVATLQEQTQPADDLQSLQPEWDTARWEPTWHSANCTFDHPTIDDCWEIHFIVWVPGLPGNVMAGRRQVEASWIVDGSKMVFSPNRRARGFFSAAEGSSYTSQDTGA
jgi:putative oxidoreductase